jgi:SAM-dependent methyltransferase
MAAAAGRRIDGRRCREDIDALRYNQHMTDGQTTVARFDQWAPWYNDSALQPMLYEAVHALVLGPVRQRHFVAAPVVGRRLWDRPAAVFGRRPLPGHRAGRCGRVGRDVVGRRRHRSVGAEPCAVGAGSRRAATVRRRRVDLVTATLTYRHWADQAAGVAEVGRVLTPGGVFGLAALLTPAFGSSRRWPRSAGRARLPAPLVAALTGAGLHANSVEEVAGFGPIPEVTFVLARRVPGQ